MENNYNNYNPYTNPGNGFRTESKETQYEEIKPDETKKKKGAFEGFGVTLVKTVTIALVFGLVAGVAGSTVLHFSGITLGAYEETADLNKEEVGDVAHTVTGGIQQTNVEGTSSVAVMDVSDVVENTMPCVVAIHTVYETTYQYGWGRTYTEEDEGAGTGFIIKQDKKYIYIATNNHVVADATSLTVQLCDGSEVTAKVKGTVETKDLAVVTVEVSEINKDTLKEIRVATLGDSNQLKAGEPAIAIGNALGYGQSVTTGVISATGRSVTVTDSTTGTTVVNNNLIQTDAAINPGNSGGALLNNKGEVIGINSVKYADTYVEGIGYAIPINDAMLIIEKLIDGEKIDASSSGYLGIQGQDCDLGAYVYSVLEESAAEKAGIQSGDIIIEFEGSDIATMSQLKELLSYYPAGEEVEFVLLRSEGEDEYTEIEVTVTLGDASIIPQ